MMSIYVACNHPSGSVLLYNDALESDLTQAICRHPGFQFQLEGPRIRLDAGQWKLIPT